MRREEVVVEEALRRRIWPARRRKGRMGEKRWWKEATVLVMVEDADLATASLERSRYGSGELAHGLGRRI
ncbi:hypothetical protein E2562_025796 [Oryza meyeriana var. granulata]|uniref:DUF834 domain-containing protein n=1 Tax=Oryza meyeriana var. granulata TaxID=110450 RepID=A0A6G1CT24_9ORYZ|nr:hypothetical protein E2562_025796 [Oryza meyeriana var. granulata]